MAENKLAPPCRVVLIGGSAGSLEVLLTILPELKPKIRSAIIIVLHRKSSSESSLTDLLSARTPLTVKEVEEKEPIQPSTIYLAPSDYHLLIEKDCTFSLDYSEKIHYSRPSIDVTFDTAAEALGNSSAAILLSGANQDGVEGLRAIKEAGGTVVVQNPNTAEVPYMPRYAIDHVPDDLVLSPSEMAGFILEF